MDREQLFYNMIFKRKSFHLFRNNKTKEYYSDSCKITDSELEEIYAVFKSLKPLVENIKVDIRIAKNELTIWTLPVSFVLRRAPAILSRGLWKKRMVNSWCIVIKSRVKEASWQYTK